jgi:hypothetical protein
MQAQALVAQLPRKASIFLELQSPMELVLRVYWSSGTVRADLCVQRERG